MLICCDIESDGPIPHKFSMVCFGAVCVEPTLSKTFYGQTKPISDEYVPDALAVSGFTREQHLKFDDPKEVMTKFDEWIAQNNTKGRPIFISDNNGYDFAWINFYFHYFLGRNPFGYSSRRIGDLWCGYQNNMYANWKWMRKINHDHNPLNDCIGNAQSILHMKELGLNIC